MFKVFILVLFISAMLLVFFCPILISALSGNWWFMLLFIITWIPTLVMFLLLGASIEFGLLSS